MFVLVLVLPHYNISEKLLKDWEWKGMMNIIDWMN
jgi:hypothetical protein